MKDDYCFCYLIYLALSGIHLHVDVCWESEEVAVAEPAKAD